MTSLSIAHASKEKKTYEAKILVAEDNSVTCELITLLLLSLGHEVDPVSDGEKALEALTTTPYDVVFLDFHLPKMSGANVINRYIEQNRGTDLPRFIALTADMRGLMNSLNTHDNFDLYLPKPFSRQDICAAIEKSPVE